MLLVVKGEIGHPKNPSFFEGFLYGEVIKNFKTYEEQIDYLCVNKKIIFNQTEIHDAILLLKLNNYYNVINPVKLVMSSGKDALTKKHIYEYKEYAKWKCEYNNMIKVSAILNTKILEIERTLNSYLSYEISYTYMKHLKNVYKKDISSFLKTYSDTLVSQLRIFKQDVLIPKDSYGKIDYNKILSQSWKLIPKITLKNLIRIFKKSKGYQKKYYYINNTIIKFEAELDTLCYLRNELFHNTPLLIVMNSKDEKLRKSTYNLIKKMLKSELKEISLVESCYSRLSSYNK